MPGSSPYTITPETHRGRGAQWVMRQDLEQLARQTRIKSQDNNTLIITPGPDGPTLYVPEQAGTAGTTTFPVLITAKGWDVAEYDSSSSSTSETSGVLKSSSSSLSIDSSTSGTGDSTKYTCDVYGNGPDVGTTVADARLRILQIADDETIPNGTWLLATLIGTIYYGQIPIWL